MDDMLAAKIGNLENTVAQLRREKTETAIREAVACGKIAARDYEAQKQWRELIMASDSNLLLLARLPARDLSTRITKSYDNTSSPACGAIQITRESAESELVQYQTLQAKSPREAGAFYASNIAPRLAAGESLPVMASNTTGTLAGALVAQRCLELLVQQNPILTEVTTDLSAEGGLLGQKVYTRYASIPSVQAYSVASGYVDTSATTTDASVTIDQHRYCQVSFNETELASTSRRLLDEQSYPLLAAMSGDIVAALYAKLTNANYASKTACSLASFDRTTLIGMAKAMTLAGIPYENRQLLLTPEFYGKLCEDETIVSGLVNQASGSAIATGTLPRVHGFKIHECASLPDNSEHLEGFAFSKSALLLAVRLPNDYTVGIPTAMGYITPITEPMSGLSLLLTKFADFDMGRAKQRLSWMYGVAVGQAAAGRRLVHA